MQVMHRTSEGTRVSKGEFIYKKSARGLEEQERKCVCK